MTQSNVTAKNLTRILDALIPCPNWATTMRSTLGLSERTAYEWRAQSIAARKANDTSSPFWLSWMGVFDWWDSHASRARVMNLISIEAQARDQMQNGVTEPMYGPDQKPLFLERPETIGRSDDWIREHDGLMDIEPVDRLLRDPITKHPIPQTKQTQLAAPLKKAILAASHPDYRESISVDVEHRGTVHVAPALERLASEPRPAMEEIKILASLSPEERRKRLGASATPLGLTHKPPSHVENVPEPEPSKPAPSYAKPIRHPGMKMV